MIQNPQEILPPLPMKGGFLTRVTAFVRLGRGVVGNTTFGLWAACLLALGLGVTFIVYGYPAYAIGELIICASWYTIYQGLTWYGVGKSPDPGVTGDEDYAGIIAAKHMGSKNPELVRLESSVMGASESLVENIGLIPHEGGQP